MKLKPSFCDENKQPVYFDVFLSSIKKCSAALLRSFRSCIIITRTQFDVLTIDSGQVAHDRSATKVGHVSPLLTLMEKTREKESTLFL